MTIGELKSFAIAQVVAAFVNATGCHGMIRNDDCVALENSITVRSQLHHETYEFNAKGRVTLVNPEEGDEFENETIETLLSERTFFMNSSTDLYNATIAMVHAIVKE